MRSQFRKKVFSTLISASVFLGSSPAIAESFDLARCLAVALEHNFELRLAQEKIEQAHGALIETRAALYPKLALQIQADEKDKSYLSQFGGRTFGSQDSWTSSATLSETLYSGEGNSAAFARAKLEKQAAQWEFRSVADQTLVAVKEKYFAVLLAQAQIEVEAQNIRLLEEEVRSEKLKLKSGTVSDFNVLRAEVALANAQTPLIRARNEERLRLEELRLVMGLPDDLLDAQHEKFSVAGVLKAAPRPTALTMLLSLAAEHRPELLQLKTVAEASTQGITLARSGYLPQISMQLAYSAQKDFVSSRYTDEQHGWTAGAQMSWNVFDSMATSGRVAQAQAQARSAQLSVEQQQLSVSVDVRRAYSSLVEAQELVSASAKVVEQALESVRLARARFEAGSGTQLETLDSQYALTQARTNEVRARHDFCVAEAHLLRSIGMEELP